MIVLRGPLLPSPHQRPSPTAPRSAAGRGLFAEQVSCDSYWAYAMADLAALKGVLVRHQMMHLVLKQRSHVPFSRVIHITGYFTYFLSFQRPANGEL
jgi:hypothetical protein